MSPATMRSLVRVAPHEDNRKLRVEVDSAGYFRASEIDLDGKNAPPNHYFAWSELPAGSYSIVVTVLGANGRRVSSDLPFEVLGSRAPNATRLRLREKVAPPRGQSPPARSGADLCRGKRHDATAPFGHQPTGDAAQDLQAVSHPVQERLFDGPIANLDERQEQRHRHQPDQDPV